MKTPSFRVFLPSTLAVVAGGLLISGSTQAGIIAINTSATNASITFDDTNSFASPNFGITNSGPSVSPWNGSTVSLPTTTDPNTLDFASGDIDASFIFSSNTYAINLSNITLNQAVTNTGFAQLDFAFNVEYQLDGSGLPSQATLYPNFVVNGTVQPSPSFAAVKGFIDYSGVNIAGTYGVLETVNYNTVWNVPGPFSATAFGIPVSGTTPLLVPNTTLTLNGLISFVVDPASINAYSVQSIPEPTSLAMFGFAMLGLARRRRLK